MRSDILMPPKGDHRVARGMTISELVVAIGIIMILLAMLVPGLSQVRGASVGVRCLSNLSQAAQATMAYAAEQQDSLPFATSQWGSSSILWNAAIVRSNSIRCPANRQEPRVGSYQASISLWTDPHFLSGTSMPGIKVTDSPVRLSQVQYSSQKVLALEAQPWHYDVQYNPSEPDYARHRAGDLSSVVFVDGHGVALDYFTFCEGFYPGMSKVIEAPYSAFWGTEGGYAGKDVR